MTLTEARIAAQRAGGNLAMPRDAHDFKKMIEAQPSIEESWLGVDPRATTPRWFGGHLINISKLTRFGNWYQPGARAMIGGNPATRIIPDPNSQLPFIIMFEE